VLKSPRRIALGGFVLFRKGVEVVVAVEPVGRATRTGAAQMQLPQKLRLRPGYSTARRWTTPRLLWWSRSNAHAFAEIIDSDRFQGQCRSPRI
jgi:hypothetical protein